MAIEKLTLSDGTIIEYDTEAIAKRGDTIVFIRDANMWKYRLGHTKIADVGYNRSNWRLVVKKEHPNPGMYKCDNGNWVWYGLAGEKLEPGDRYIDIKNGIIYTSHGGGTAQEYLRKVLSIV